MEQPQAPLGNVFTVLHKTRWSPVFWQGWVAGFGVSPSGRAADLRKVGSFRRNESREQLCLDTRRLLPL